MGAKKRSRNKHFYGRERKTVLSILSSKHGWKCWYCGEPLTPDTASIDHILPQCDGGDDHISNLALCCIFCNRAKYTFPVDVFLDWLGRVKMRNQVPLYKEAF